MTMTCSILLSAKIPKQSLARCTFLMCPVFIRCQTATECDRLHHKVNRQFMVQMTYVSTSWPYPTESFPCSSLTSRTRSPRLVLRHKYHGHFHKIAVHDLIRHYEVMENLVILMKWLFHTSP